MIPRETGRGLSVGGAHRLAAVERLVGATLVVALPLNGATVRRPLPGHYRTGGVERRLSSRRPGSASGGVFQAPTGTGVLPGAGNGDVERRLSRGTMRPRRAPTRGAPTVTGDWKFQRSPPPAGLRHDPARNWAGIVHRRHPPRCRCRTTRRGDPCGRPPPNGATVRRPLPGHYRTGGVERRLSGADWDRRPSGRRAWRRGAATQPRNDATPQGTHKGCPYDHRGLEVTKKKSPTAGPPA